MMSRDILFVPRIISVIFARGNKTTGPTLSFPFPLNCVRMPAKSHAKFVVLSYRDLEIRDDSGAFFRI